MYLCTYVSLQACEVKYLSWPLNKAFVVIITAVHVHCRLNTYVSSPSVLSGEAIVVMYTAG